MTTKIVDGCRGKEDEGGGGGLSDEQYKQASSLLNKSRHSNMAGDHDDHQRTVDIFIKHLDDQQNEQQQHHPNKRRSSLPGDAIELTTLTGVVRRRKQQLQSRYEQQQQPNPNNIIDGSGNNNSGANTHLMPAGGVATNKTNRPLSISSISSAASSGSTSSAHSSSSSGIQSSLTRNGSINYGRCDFRKNYLASLESLNHHHQSTTAATVSPQNGATTTTNSSNNIIGNLDTQSVLENAFKNLSLSSSVRFNRDAAATRAAVLAAGESQRRNFGGSPGSNRLSRINRSLHASLRYDKNTAYRIHLMANARASLNNNGNTDAIVESQQQQHQQRSVNVSRNNSSTSSDSGQGCRSHSSTTKLHPSPSSASSHSNTSSLFRDDGFEDDLTSTSSEHATSSIYHSSSGSSNSGGGRTHRFSSTSSQHQRSAADNHQHRHHHELMHGEDDEYQSCEEEFSANSHTTASTTSNLDDCALSTTSSSIINHHHHHQQVVLDQVSLANVKQQYRKSLLLEHHHLQQQQQQYLLHSSNQNKIQALLPPPSPTASIHHPPSSSPQSPTATTTIINNKNNSQTSANTSGTSLNSSCCSSSINSSSTSSSVVGVKTPLTGSNKQTKCDDRTVNIIGHMPTKSPGYWDTNLSITQRVVTEIIETERTYVDDLEQIVTGYICYLRNILKQQQQRRASSQSHHHHHHHQHRGRANEDDGDDQSMLVFDDETLTSATNDMDDYEVEDQDDTIKENLVPPPNVIVKAKSQQDINKLGTSLSGTATNENEKIASAIDIKKLFSNLEDVYKFNKDLLFRLEECYLNPSSLAECFVENASGFDIYTQYCTSYPQVVSTLTELMANPSSAQLLKERQKELNQSLPLGAYLLKPVQRILKYHILFQSLINHTTNDETVDEKDRQLIGEAFSVMTDIACHINTMKRRHEHSIRVQEVQGLLCGWEGPDLTTLGELILEDSFKLYNRQKSSRHLFLFDNVLLMTKKKRDGSLCYKGHIECSNLMLIENIEGQPLVFNTVPFDNPKALCSFQAKNLDKKRDWCLQMKEVIIKSFEVQIPIHVRDILMSLTNSNSSEQVKKTNSKSSSSDTSRAMKAPNYLEKKRIRQQDKKK